MIEKNRSNNFKFNDNLSPKDATGKTSVAHAHYDYKGNANEIRPKLDPETKKDLRNHHFLLGSQPLEY